MKNNLTKIEQEVLNVYLKENPSIISSNKGRKEFKKYQKKLDFLLNNLMHFPSKMFKDSNLIDFGSGTGESTIHFALSGANCTLVDYNKNALEIAKKSFKKYSRDFNKHKFICSSIFNHFSKKKYDIVVSLGLLHHTKDKEKAFKKIIKFLKPKGYLILSMSNPSGSFQNNLQRLIVYKFAKTWDAMVNVAEELFKEDISRSKKYSNRTRKEIIFDRFVVPKQNSFSVSELIKLFQKSKIEFYSSYPSIMPNILGDSWLNNNKLSLGKVSKNFGSLSEAFWLSHKDNDEYEVPKVLNTLNNFSNFQHSMTDYINDIKPDTKKNFSILEQRIKLYERELAKIDYLDYIKKKQNNFLLEVKILLKLLKSNDFIKIKNFLKKTKYLFKGSNGLRAIHFVGRKV